MGTDHPELGKRSCCEFGYYYNSAEIKDIFGVRQPEPLKLYHPIKCITETPGEYTWIGNWMKEELWKEAYEKALEEDKTKPWPPFTRTALLSDHLKFNENPAMTFDHTKEAEEKERKKKE